MYKKYHTHDQVGVIPVSQGGLTYTNQSVWYIILTKERQKTHDHLNKMSKKHLTKFNIIPDKNSYSSGYRGNIPQHNKSHI